MQKTVEKPLHKTVEKHYKTNEWYAKDTSKKVRAVFRNKGMSGQRLGGIAPYHNTWRLLKAYRDVVWSMEVSVSQLKNEFQVEYGSSIEEFLDSV